VLRFGSDVEVVHVVDDYFVRPGKLLHHFNGCLAGRAARAEAALPSARTGKHSEAATDPRGSVQSQPDPAPTTGRGHAAGVEEPLRQACFDPLLTL